MVARCIFHFSANNFTVDKIAVSITYIKLFMAQSYPCWEHAPLPTECTACYGGEQQFGSREVKAFYLFSWRSPGLQLVSLDLQQCFFRFKSKETPEQESPRDGISSISQKTSEWELVRGVRTYSPRCYCHQVLPLQFLVWFIDPPTNHPDSVYQCGG